MAIGVSAVALVAARHRAIAGGVFAFGDVQPVAGIVVERPYPALRVAGRSAATLLVAPASTAPRRWSAASLTARSSSTVSASPVMATRCWRSRARNGYPDHSGSCSRSTSREELREHSRTCVTLRGEIVDSKCFLGVMTPGQGKTHRACASLCLRGGIPPALFVEDRAGASRLVLLVSPAGDALDPAIVADRAFEPTEMTGRLERTDGWWRLRTDPATLAPPRLTPSANGRAMMRLPLEKEPTWPVRRRRPVRPRRRRAGLGAGPFPRRDHGRLSRRRGARRRRPAGHRSRGRRFRGAGGRGRPAARLVRSQQRRERGAGRSAAAAETRVSGLCVERRALAGPAAVDLRDRLPPAHAAPRARATQAAHALVDRLAPGDYCGIYIFDKELTELATFTRDRDLLHRAIRTASMTPPDFRSDSYRHGSAEDPGTPLMQGSIGDPDLWATGMRPFEAVRRARRSAA